MIMIISNYSWYVQLCLQNLRERERGKEEKRLYALEDLSAFNNWGM